MALSESEFEQFYERNYQHVYRICYTYMKNSYDAEDCCEDTFVKVIRNNQLFNDFSHEKAWLTVTAINTCKDHLRQFWRRNVMTDEMIEQHAVTQVEKQDELLQQIMDLPAKYKDVIYLHYYMGYKTEEIARMLKKPASTIRNRLAKARNLLKERLEDET